MTSPSDRTKSPSVDAVRIGGLTVEQARADFMATHGSPDESQFLEALNLIERLDAERRQLATESHIKPSISDVNVDNADNVRTKAMTDIKGGSET